MPASNFDANIEINEENWAVTVVRTHNIHAEMMIEGSGQCLPWCTNDPIRDKRIHWRRLNEGHWIVGAHLRPSNGLPFPDLLLDKRPWKNAIVVYQLTPSEIHYHAKSMTFQLSRDQARDLLLAVEKDVMKPPIFNIFGDRSIFSQKWSMFRKIYQQPYTSESGKHNCITWIREKLRVAGILLPIEKSDIVFTSTMQYTDGGKLSLRAR